MGSSDEADLEDFWTDIRAVKPSLVQMVDGSPVNGGIDLAKVKTLSDLKDEVGQPAGEKVLQTFLDHWREDLRARGPAGLIELLLTDTGLSVQEIKGFMRALPISLLERVSRLGAAAGTANGVHALVSLEWQWRNRRETLREDYVIRRDMQGLLEVEVHPLGQNPFTFSLTDTFNTTDAGV